MWYSEKWNDYELIDAEGGERLERWGDYILIRPDPQIIWTGERKDPRWRKADGVYRRSKSGGGKWVVCNIPDEYLIFKSLATHKAGRRNCTTQCTGAFCYGCYACLVAWEVRLSLKGDFIGIGCVVIKQISIGFSAFTNVPSRFRASFIIIICSYGCGKLLCLIHSFKED